MTDTTDLKARLPVFGYAYRYPEGEARSVIRFATGGRSINGSRPTEVIELCRLDEAADALDAKDRTIERLEAENNQLWFAYEELRFQIYWRVDGMNTEQALVHAKARTTEARAALRGQTP